MNATVQQRALPLVDQSILPLCDIGYARTRIGLREDAVMDQIVDGKLRYAFHIESPKAERMEVRILTECVEALRAKMPQPEYRDVASRILPMPTARGKFKTIRAVVLAERFICSQWLIGHLIESGELKLCPLQVGPKTSPFIDHASVVNFLTRRTFGKQPNT